MQALDQDARAVHLLSGLGRLCAGEDSLAAGCSGRSAAPRTPPRRSARAPAGHPAEPGLLTWGHVPDDIRPRRVAHPLAEQDDSRRDRSATGEGVALVTVARPRDSIGPHQIQAVIADLHDEAQSPEATGWPQIAALYDVLLRLDDYPAVAPKHAVAISMVAGPRAGLDLVQRLGTDPRSAGGHVSALD